MRKIKIMADSASDITQAKAKELGITVIPGCVNLGQENFRDGVDIQSKEFFAKVIASDVMPKSSQPSPEAFMEEFRKYEDYDDILCLALTSKSSGTYNSACLAKQMLEEENFGAKIHIFDTLNASITILSMVKNCNKMILEGKTVQEIIKHLESIRDKMSLYFVCDTLDYLKKGGRINTATYAIGTLLKIKPIITFFKGAPIDCEKVRGIDQARRKLIELFEQKSEAFSEISIIHAVNMEQAKKLEEEIKAKFNDIKVHMYEVGASTGTHTGPGAFGVIFCEKAPRW
ncbi:MAG: DegV family protein [Clostridia bacterium]